MANRIFKHRRAISAAFFWATGALVAAGYASPALAQTSLTGEFFRDACVNGTPSTDISAMAGGLSFGLLTGQSLGGPSRAYCPPNSGRITNAAAGRAVCKFIEAHPNVAGQDIYVAIGVALLQTYPCTAEDKK